MNKILLFSFAAVALLSASFYVFSSKGLELQLKSSSDYTYYNFELEWPGSVCQTKKCNQSVTNNFDGKNFNIHGLWPSGSSSDACYYPDTCSSQSLSYNSIDKETLTYMDSYWNSLYQSTESFIEHEWTKHGTCFNGDMGTFFKTAVSLHQKLNPVRALAQSGIVPNASQGYSASDMLAALEKNLGGPVSMKCQKQNGNQLFVAVDLFLDKQYNLIENPCKKNESVCRTDAPVYFPSL